MADADNDRYNVPGLERGLRLLGEFSRAEPVLAAPELARRLGVPRSTVFRLLTTLENLGFVERTPDGRAYRLGLAILRMGFEYLASLDIVELGRPLLEALRDDSGHAASLVVRDGRDVVYLHRASSRSPFATSVQVGTRLPAHATVFGHVLLGDLPLAALRALYPEPTLETRSPRTPADVATLFEQVQKIRAEGVVVAEGFFESHICTVAAPVRAEGGHIVAALGLTVPGSAIETGRGEVLAAQVRAAAEHLSRLLNYRHASTPSSVVPLRAA